MRDAHLPLQEPGTARDHRCRAVQDDCWFPGGVVANLDIPPSDGANTRAERLRRRFFGGKPDSERRCPTGGIRALVRSVHPREESLAIPRDRRRNARDLYDINADSETRIGWRDERAQPVSVQRRRR